MAVIRSVIRGVGAYLPKRVITNDDMARLVDTTDEWIKERTGIEQRHIAEEGELTSDLGIAASRQALVRAGIDPIDIDLVVCATSTPDVRLRNPLTGQTFTCSGEAGRTGGRWWDEMAKRTRDNCVKDLETQGYVIIKDPASR